MHKCENVYSCLATSREYNFDDEWRLTEKQIEQYNNILQDTNYIRKYARLEAIANKFEAYPPFGISMAIQQILLQKIHVTG